MMLPPFGPKCLTASFVARIVPSTLEHFSIRLTVPVSLPGLTGQSSIPGRWLLDRPVKPGDDSAEAGQPNRKNALSVCSINLLNLDIRVADHLPPLSHLLPHLRCKFLRRLC